MGAHPKMIQDQLGHQDIQTTFNTYGHLLPATHEALAAQLDAFITGQPETVPPLDPVHDGDLAAATAASGEVQRPTEMVPNGLPALAVG